MTQDDFDAAVNSLSAKLLTVITSHTPAQFEVVAAAAFAMMEAVLMAAPEDAGDSVAALAEALAELQRLSSHDRNEVLN